jgi:hypothetical protein
VTGRTVTRLVAGTTGGGVVARVDVTAILDGVLLGATGDELRGGAAAVEVVGDVDADGDGAWLALVQPPTAITIGTARSRAVMRMAGPFRNRRQLPT